MSSTNKQNQDPNFPSSFSAAVKDKNWCDVINRKYNAFRNHDTWTYYLYRKDINVIPVVWVFQLIPINRSGTDFIYKAPCVLEATFNDCTSIFDLSQLYAQVSSREAVQLLFAYAASHDLTAAGGYVANAYLYSKIDCTIYIE